MFRDLNIEHWPSAKWIQALASSLNRSSNLYYSFKHTCLICYYTQQCSGWSEVYNVRIQCIGQFFQRLHLFFSSSFFFFIIFYTYSSSSSSCLSFGGVMWSWTSLIPVQYGHVVREVQSFLLFLSFGLFSLFLWFLSRSFHKGRGW